MFEILYFLLFTSVLMFSCLGHGIIFTKLFNLKSVSNIGMIGILGLINLTFISYISVLVIGDKKLLNIFLLLIGIFIFMYNRKKILLKKEILILAAILSISIFISKTHDDFPFYHLQQSLNFSLNNLYIGLPNLNFFYSYHSSILFLNSLFYFPYFEHYLFHLPNFFFLLFSQIIFIENVFKNENRNFLKFYSLFCSVFILLKFTRLSEYGTDLAGQILVLISFLVMFKFLNNKKNKDNLIIFISIVILALTIKTYFIFYFLLILFVLSTIATRDLFKFLKNNKIYMIYSSIFIIFFLTLNIFSTGCLIFPISISCFSELSWSMPITEVQHYSKWFEIWSKSLAGAGYVVDNSRNLTSDFKWVEIWYKNYSKKYFETIYLLVFISLCFLYFFKSHKIKLKSNKSFNYVISFVLFILIFWFIKHPTLRYGGYLIHVLIFSLILSKILERTTMTSLNIAKKSKLIVAICLCFFFFKNINRINDEFKRNDQYKFINFPYYFVKKTEFEKITYNNNVDIYFVDGACWATPPPCSANKDVIIKEFFGFKIINTKN